MDGWQWVALDDVPRYLILICVRKNDSDVKCFDLAIPSRHS